MTAPTQPDQIAKAWARWIRDAPISARTEAAFRAGVEYALSALPRMQPSDAEVERAARRIAWAHVGGEAHSPWAHPTTQLYIDGNWHRFVSDARAVFLDIPAPPMLDAAALRAEGFAAGRDAAWTLADRMWPEAHDLLDAIAALKVGGGT